MHTWAIQDAKARFSELVNECRDSGPQMVTRHGEAAVVVVPVEQYERLSRPRQSLGAFFAAAPRAELDFSRSPDQPRDIEL